MWINRETWDGLKQEIRDLRERVRELESGGRASFYNGKVSVQRTGHYRLEDAVNVLADHVGATFSVEPAVEASLKVLGPPPSKRSSAGKNDG